MNRSNKQSNLLLNLYIYLDLIKINIVVAILTTNPFKNVLKPGKSGTVAQFSDDQLGSKLLTMGVLPGSQVEIVREAPFGGGVVIKVDNNYLALRKQEVQCILLK